MNFNIHRNLEGLHAPFPASQSAWLRYDDDKAKEAYSRKKSAELGSRLHAWAKDTIDLGIKQPKSKKTLYEYVNDAIGFKMATEVVLFYSDRFFGTADAISFKNNFLRIHDYKSGITPVHMDQLYIYAALFCLEYVVKPENIKIELRIYKQGEALCDEPDPEVIRAIMNKIVDSDRFLRKLKEEER